MVGEGSSPPHSGGLSDLLNVIQDSKRNDEFNLKFTAPNTDKWFPGQSNSEGYTLASAVTPSAFSFREKDSKWGEGQKEESKYLKQVPSSVQSLTPGSIS